MLECAIEDVRDVVEVVPLPQPDGLPAAAVGDALELEFEAVDGARQLVAEVETHDDGEEGAQARHEHHPDGERLGQPG
jgi:hypothetical protein